MSNEALVVENLRMQYAASSATPITALDGISLSIARGETLGVVGESGCGKSSLALTLMGILPPGARTTDGSIKLNGRELVGRTDEQLNEVRWDEISMIFQGAMNALNPVKTVGHQLMEPAIRRFAKHQTTKKEAEQRAHELLHSVDLIPAVMKRYPHELSGGMKQRVIIAMSLMCSPDVVIADEPTTALDVIAQDRVLALLDKVREESQLAVLLISHDIGVILETCDHIAVMYAGQIVEMGPVETVFAAPKHPYTRALLGSIPSLTGERKSLLGIKGEPPSLANPPDGCRFAARCGFATELCLESANSDIQVGGDRITKCIRVSELDTLFAEAERLSAGAVGS